MEVTFPSPGGVPFLGEGVTRVSMMLRRSDESRVSDERVLCKLLTRVRCVTCVTRVR